MKKILIVASLLALLLLLVLIDYLLFYPGSMCPEELYAGMIDDTLTYGYEGCRTFLDYFNHSQETGKMTFHRLMKIYGVVVCIIFVVWGVRGLTKR